MVFCFVRDARSKFFEMRTQHICEKGRRCWKLEGTEFSLLQKYAASKRCPNVQRCRKLATMCGNFMKVLGYRRFFILMLAVDLWQLMLSICRLCS